MGHADRKTRLPLGRSLWRARKSVNGSSRSGTSPTSEPSGQAISRIISVSIAKPRAALKRVDPALKVGGPATADNQWVPEFLDFCTADKVAGRFHQHPPLPDRRFRHARLRHHHATRTYSTRECMRDEVTTVRQQARDLPLYYTEWNISSNPRDPFHDQPFAAAFATRIVMEAQGLLAGLQLLDLQRYLRGELLPFRSLPRRLRSAEHLRHRETRLSRVSVTASTGRAAAHGGGQSRDSERVGCPRGARRHCSAHQSRHAAPQHPDGAGEDQSLPVRRSLAAPGSSASTMPTPIRAGCGRKWVSRSISACSRSNNSKQHHSCSPKRSPGRGKRRRSFSRRPASAKRRRHHVRIRMRLRPVPYMPSAPDTSSPPRPADAEMLDALQRVSFDYFLKETNPVNGLIADTNRPGLTRQHRGHGSRHQRLHRGGVAQCSDALARPRRRS